jgi:hypothetical protein
VQRGTLVTISGAHLVVALTSMKVSVARRSAYHLPWLHGDPCRVVRDSIVMGTALSEPVVMMVAEALALRSVVQRDSRRAVATLGWLGALNLPGYLLEQQVRLRLRPSGWDTTETPLALSGLALAAVMVAIARPAMRLDDRAR